jgi:glycerol uptake facilitator-like aquaporin
MKYIHIINMYQYLCEFIGTFILIYILLKTGHWFIISFTSILLFTIGSNYYPISLNPAITIAHYASNKISLFDLTLYIIAELLGAIAAFMVFKYCKSSNIFPYPCKTVNNKNNKYS